MKTLSMPPLKEGDRLDQKTFHARYEAMAEDFRAELIAGVVHIPLPHNMNHGQMQARLIHWIGLYEEDTPGTEVLGPTTNILGEDSEPQPDMCLLIEPSKGGQTREEDEYLVGPPEFIVEVALSTEAIDLHGKKDDYERAGVREYVVVALRQKRVYWFVSRNGQFEELTLGDDGIFRSEVFPGLWLDPAALLRLDAPRICEVLQQGLATPEHAAFVARLAT